VGLGIGQDLGVGGAYFSRITQVQRTTPALVLAGII
jgi:hypothetical protein